jgi:hypothetical protein
MIAASTILWSAVAYFADLLWYLLNFILIVTKRDPLYDRLARASALCD